MWPESEGGRRRGWTPPSSFFPPKHLINSLKERCNVFCIYTCLTLRWKVICSCHHSKLIKNEITGLSKAVGSCCSVMGCRSYRLNFSKGGGGVGGDQEVKVKKNWFETLIYMYTHHMIIRLNMWKLVYDIFFMSCFIILNIT